MGLDVSGMGGKGKERGDGVYFDGVGVSRREAKV